MGSPSRLGLAMVVAMLEQQRNQHGTQENSGFRLRNHLKRNVPNIYVIPGLSAGNGIETQLRNEPPVLPDGREIDLIRMEFPVRNDVEPDALIFPKTGFVINIPEELGPSSKRLH